MTLTPHWLQLNLYYIYIRYNRVDFEASYIALYIYKINGKPAEARYLGKQIIL